MLPFREWVDCFRKFERAKRCGGMFLNPSTEARPGSKHHKSILRVGLNRRFVELGELVGG
jgi:hypothetical protein